MNEFSHLAKNDATFQRQARANNCWLSYNSMHFSFHKKINLNLKYKNKLLS